jgi:uncharacterized YigZ family protein
MHPPRAVIRTLAAPLRREPPKIKGSRFIASVDAIASTTDADEFVKARRREFHDATHNCFAWRLDEDQAFRYSDDGEPAGTAGRPILREIDGRRLTRVVVVVTRYFGGTRLGTGGLVRAYAGATAEALDGAEIVERPVVKNLAVTFAYPLGGVVRGVFGGFDLSIADAEYGTDVRMRIAVPVADCERLRDALRDATAARIRIVEEEE